MKQTAVEWLEKICNDRGYYLMSEYFKQAKEMEKEQIIHAYKSGINCISDADADFYYTINYKSFYPEK